MLPRYVARSHSEVVSCIRVAFAEKEKLEHFSTVRRSRSVQRGLAVVITHIDPLRIQLHQTCDTV